MIYPINAECSGLFVMINNIEFKQLPYRYGAENDQIVLKSLFESMNYAIKIVENLTDKNMDDELDDVGENTGEYESLVLIISSHGADGVVCGTDHTKNSALELKINKIVKKFQNKNWAGKPKVIIFQACQGDVVDVGFDLELEEKKNQG